MSRPYTFGSLFMGGALADIGMIAAGWAPLWGVEYDRAIASVAERNIGHNVIVQDVRSVCYEALERPDHLHASPVCKNASVANSDGKESREDIETAEAVCRAVRALLPRTVTIENVYGYRKFQAFKNICRALDECGYWWQMHHCNAADFGVPQTRKRLIVRATLGDHLPPLPSPVPWAGWYAAIEDLIPTLPASAFAPWQLERLPEELFGSCVVEGSAAGVDNAFDLPVRGAGDPIFTVRGTNPTRAFLVSDQTGNEGTECGRSPHDEPAGTVRTHERGGSVPRAFLCHGTSTMEVRDDGEPAAAVVATVHGKAAVPRAFLMMTKHHCHSPLGREGRGGVIPGAEPANACLPGSVGARAFLIEGDNSGRNGPLSHEAANPAPCVVGSSKPKAFFVDGKPLNYDGDLQIKEGASETATQTQHPFRAWLSQGRVVAMTPRALARFQSVPDTYELPASKRLACQIIGNGVPSLMMQRIAETLTP